MRKRLLPSLVLLGLITAFLYIPVAVSAGSIGVSPAIIDGEVSSPNEEKTTSITITNSFTEPVTLSARLESINLDSGLLAPTGQAENTLSQNVIFSTSDITVPANGSSTLAVTLRNTPDLTPGGHYAALLLTEKDVGGGSVNFHSAISLGVFFIKRGGERQSIRLISFTDDRFIFSLPKTVNLTFLNDGNVHIVPRASVNVTKTGSTSVFSQGVANATSTPVFPSKSLDSKVTLKSLKRAWSPGKYTLHVQTRADGIDGFEDSTRSFYYIPPLFLTLVSLVILVLILLSIPVFRLIARPKKPKSTAKTEVKTENPHKIHVRVTKRINVKSNEAKSDDIKVNKNN